MLIEAALQDNSVFTHGRNRAAHDLLVGLEVTGLLDFGCGNAPYFAVGAATELGLKVHACDIDADVVDELKDRYGARLDIFAVPESEATLRLEDGQVSAVTCLDVLEHMPPASRVTALRELRRVLADDGALIVTTPHKGLLSFIDPENVRYYLPRTHKLVYTLLRGRDAYQSVYGGERFGNFSSGARRHDHFSRRELSELLTSAGFRVEAVRFFSLIHPLVKVPLWFTEALGGRVWGADRLTALLVKIYVWDAHLEPGRLAFSIGIRARKSCP